MVETTQSQLQTEVLGTSFITRTVEMWNFFGNKSWSTRGTQSYWIDPRPHHRPIPPLSICLLTFSLSTPSIPFRPLSPAAEGNRRHVAKRFDIAEVFSEYHWKAKDEQDCAGVPPLRRLVHLGWRLFFQSASFDQQTGTELSTIVNVCNNAVYVW